MEKIKGGVTAAKGFYAASAAAGIKYEGRTDMALIYSKKACKAAGKLSIIFTAREDWIQDYYKMGFDMVTFGMDASVMVNGFKKLVADNK